MISLNKDNIGLCIIAYNRPYHFKKVFENILKFKNKNDKIFIFFDNVSSKDCKKTKINNLKLRNYLKKIKSSKIVVIEHKSNLGLKKNWFFTYNYTFKRYKKVICLEDDILIKKGFIEFMSFYLNKYENNKSVMNITGFSSYVKIPNNYLYDCYLTRRSMSWSQATWRRVWIDFKKINKNHIKIIKSKNQKLKLIFAGEDLLRTLTLDYLEYINTFQIWWVYNIVKKSGLCINPLKNYISNIGFDGSGVHTKKRDIIKSNKKSDLKYHKMKKIFFSESINQEFLKNFKINKLVLFILLNVPISVIRIIYKFKYFFKSKFI